VRARLWPDFAREAWAQLATVMADTTGVGAAIASVVSDGVGSASHRGGGHDRWGRCSVLCSLGWCWHSQPLGRRGRNLRALLWPLFTWSAWA
jgi:hypothetical protein